MALAISVIDELNRCAIPFDYLPNGWLRVLCPFHADTHPSCDINTNHPEGIFKCHSCNATGDFVAFLTRKLNNIISVNAQQGIQAKPLERWQVYYELQQRYGDSTDKLVEPEVIERYHQNIWQAVPLLEQLYLRGVTDESIRRYRLGEFKGRITIPIKNAQGVYINVMKYAPGAPKGTVKFKSMFGRNKPRLYPIEQLEYPALMICGGFMKAIVAAQYLNLIGVGAVTSTLGETNWDVELNPFFKDKDTAICLDIDKAGVKAASERCAHVSAFASRVRLCDIPLDINQFPKGDVNDYARVSGEHVAHNIQCLWHNASLWEPPNKITVDTSEPIDVDINHAYSAEHAQQRLRVKAIISAADQSPYHIPKVVRVKCDRQQNQCGLCPILPLKDPQPLVTIHTECEYPLKLINEIEAKQNAAIQETLGIPSCKVVQFEIEKYCEVEELRISPELGLIQEPPDSLPDSLPDTDTDTDTQENAHEQNGKVIKTSFSNDSLYAPCIAVDTKLELNDTYYLIGKMLPHPKTQAATLVISEARPAVDALSSFKLSEKDAEQLKLFQPVSLEGKPEDSYEALHAKLNDIWTDTETSVTQIYERRALHIGIDLAYFSVLYIPYYGEIIKGWAEILVVADSEQGKSTAIDRIMGHYKLGEKVVCKSATRAGLIGGSQQFNSRGKYFTKWGVFPKNDCRLLVMEELKGLPKDIFAMTTDMRSSGIADIPQIERGRTNARVRLIALSNPAKPIPVSSYNYGIDTVRDLIPNLEDIRRFDVCLVLNKNDISVKTAEPRNVIPPPAKYPAELHRKLILWCWTRQAHNVVFTPNALDYLTWATRQLCDKYVDDVPILGRATTRQKLARLAVAIACRVFSCDEEYNKVIVKQPHVKLVHEFLDKHYSSKSCGYADYSEYIKTDGILKNPESITTEITTSPHAQDLVEHLLNTTEIEQQDICDWCGWDKMQALPLISVLVRNNALIRETRFYRKTPQFIELLQKLLSNGRLGTGVNSIVPEHIRSRREKF
jgi:CHC2 zinc finger